MLIAHTMCNCTFEFQRRMTSVERSLEEAENLNKKFEKMHFLKESVHVNKNRWEMDECQRQLLMDTVYS